MGGQCGQHDRPGASACRWSASSPELGRRKKGVFHPEDEALGRGRGGLSTKLHLSCDGRGRPLSLVATPGQRHESTQLEAVLDTIRVPRAGYGRPRKRPERLFADRGYSFPSCRRLLRRRGIPHIIPEREDQRERRRGRPPKFDRESYRRRVLPQAQRGRAVCEPTQAVARHRHALRETGSQLPGGGSHRCADDLADLVNHRAGSSAYRHCYSGRLTI